MISLNGFACSLTSGEALKGLSALGIAFKNSYLGSKIDGIWTFPTTVTFGEFDDRKISSYFITPELRQHSESVSRPPNRLIFPKNSECNLTGISIQKVVEPVRI